VEAVLDGGVPQRLLRAVALVHQVVAHAEPPADLAHRRAVVAPVGERLQRQIEQVALRHDGCHVAAD
jgi:hypothetical protein